MDLPAPLAPTTPSVSPWCSVNETRSAAGRQLRGRVFRYGLLEPGPRQRHQYPVGFVNHTLLPEGFRRRQHRCRRWFHENALQLAETPLPRDYRGIRHRHGLTAGVPRRIDQRLQTWRLRYLDTNSHSIGGAR